jgi:hypothetical protein
MTTFGSSNSKDSYHLEALARGAASIRKPQRSGSRHGQTNESKDSILCDNSLYQPPSPSGTLGDRNSSRGEVGIAKMTGLNINVIPVIADGQDHDDDQDHDDQDHDDQDQDDQDQDGQDQEGQDQEAQWKPS